MMKRAPAHHVMRGRDLSDCIVMRFSVLIVALSWGSVAWADETLTTREIAAAGLRVAVEVTSSRRCEEPEPEDRIVVPGQRGAGSETFEQIFGSVGQPRSRKTQTSGTVWRADGHILTMYLDEQCEFYDVRFADGSVTGATVVGRDFLSSLALLKAERTGLPAPAFGDIGMLQPGDPVVAVSAPRGLSGTLGIGVVTSARRILPDHMAAPYNGYYIQSDAAIHMGSSGGPLLDGRGQVVGLHSAIISGSGTFEGIAFALPIDMVLRAAEDLLAHGKVRRGALGIEVEEFSGAGGPRIAVSQVFDNMPAEGALEVGDVIARVNGKEVRARGALLVSVQESRPGDEMILDILRREQPQQVRVVLSEWQAENR